MGRLSCFVTILKAIEIWALAPYIFYPNEVLYESILLVLRNFSVFAVIYTDFFFLKMMSSFKARTFLILLIPVSSQLPSTMPGTQLVLRKTLN